MNNLYQLDYEEIQTAKENCDAMLDKLDSIETEFELDIFTAKEFDSFDIKETIEKLRMYTKEKIKAIYAEQKERQYSQIEEYNNQRELENSQR